LNLKCDIVVSKFAFKCNLYRYIKDELDENLRLNDVRLVIGEWIPMGANQIVALNDKLGSSVGLCKLNSVDP
jgi:hypothetical protein